MSGEAIDIDEFEAADEGAFENRGNTERVLGFLARNSDRAWKAASIADRTGLERDSVNALLSRLKKRGLVRHKSPYWAITDDEERLESARTVHEAIERYDAEYGEEAYEDWQTDDTVELE